MNTDPGRVNVPSLKLKREQMKPPVDPVRALQAHRQRALHAHTDTYRSVLIATEITGAEK